MSEEHFRKLERMYLQAKMHQGVYDGIEIAVSESHARVSFLVDDRFHHAAGAMHGAVYFKLLDDAAYFACASLIEDVFILTKEFNV